MASSSRRLQKELAEIKNIKCDAFRVVETNEINLHKWVVMLKPEKEPYNKGCFRISLDFPVDYPFKPPKVKFLTQIYHPNVDTEGAICLGLIQSENWKPATRAEQILNALLQLLAEPEFDHPLRNDIADLYQKDKRGFFKTAEENTRKYADKVNFAG